MKILVSLALAATLTLTNAIESQARTSERTYVVAGTRVDISADDNTKVITVNLNKIQKDNVEITLQSNDGTVLFSEEVSKTERYCKKLNLSQLTNGTYSLTIKKQLSKSVQPLELTTNGVILDANDRREKFIPFVIQKGASVNVNCLTSNYTNVFVKIYDNAGHVIFEDANYVVFNVHKSYNLVKLPAGVYVLEIEAGDETSYTTLSL